MDRPQAPGRFPLCVPGVSRFIAVAALMLALAGCSSGGTVPMDGPGDADSGTLLLDKWQRFERGDPTLRLTEDQVSEAWRSVAGASTHRVIRAGPVSSGRDPEPDTPPVSDPVFPAAADACAPGECDFDSPPDGTWAFTPVLEHRDIAIAEFRSRFTRTLTLEPERGTDGEQTDLFDSLTFGGWLDYTHFNVSVTRWCTVGSPGCAGTGDADDFDPLYAGGGVRGFMAGSYSGTTPTGTGSATWTGIMVGMEDLAPGTLRRGRPDVFLGDARVAIGDLAAPNVDITFTGVHNVTEGTRHRDMHWKGLRIESGLFGSASRVIGEDDPDYVVGMFTGPGHRESGGTFRRDGIAGAFGAARQP